MGSCACNFTYSQRLPIKCATLHCFLLDEFHCYLASFNLSQILWEIQSLYILFPLHHPVSQNKMHKNEEIRKCTLCESNYYKYCCSFFFFFFSSRVGSFYRILWESYLSSGAFLQKNKQTHKILHSFRRFIEILRWPQVKWSVRWMTGNKEPGQREC